VKVEGAQCRTSTAQTQQYLDFCCIIFAYLLSNTRGATGGGWLTEI